MERTGAFGLFDQRTRIFNDISLGLAGVCLATDQPRLLIIASLLIVLLLGYLASRPYDRVFQLLREGDHPVTQVRVIWRQLLIASLGWWVFSLIALGLLGRQGFQFMGLAHF